MRITFLAVALLAVAGCRQAARPVATPPPVGPQQAFWTNVRSLCGRAFPGRVTESNASDSVVRRSTLIMHVRSCSADTMRIPFHVGTDRSRTWVLTRAGSGLRLKHDHRHQDGTEDAVTQYGGDTREAGAASRQEFWADEHTARLIPAARTNVWSMELVPGERFAYALRREGTDRRFRVDFDLRSPVPAPPPPWGASGSADARPTCGVESGRLTGDRAGAVRLGMPVDSVKRVCNVVRDTIQMPEGTPQRVIVIAVGGDTLRSWISDSGRVDNILVESPRFMTPDSVRVGVPLGRLLTYPGITGAYGEGDFYVFSDAPTVCGLSFAIDFGRQRPPFMRNPGRESLEPYATTARVGSILVRRCFPDR